MRLLRPKLATFVLALCALSKAQQRDGAVTAHIIGVQTQRFSSVIVSVGARKETVVIATCGEAESGPESICGLAAHLEVKQSGGWRPIAQRDPGRIFGGLGREKWHPVVLEVRSDRMFVFGYATDIFAVNKGQQLRLRIDTWLSVDDMRKGAQPGQIFTDVFKAP
jgi:hypothetical protein